MGRQDAVIANPWTGDYRIDALIEGPSFRWNFDTSDPDRWGQPAKLSFSFMTQVPSYASPEDGLGFKAFTAAQKAIVRECLHELSLIINVDFVEIVETTLDWGQLRFGNSLQTREQTAGYTYLPNDEAAGESSGDVYIAIGFDRDYEAGGADKETLLHEIGHAMGLKHPGDYDKTDTLAQQTSGNFLGRSEDSTLFTIMSYQSHPQGLSRDDFGLYDLLALRKMYGVRPFHVSDDHYRLGNLSGSWQATLLDDGGNDKLDLSALSSAVQINLNPGAFSSVGKTPMGKPAIDNLSVAVDTMIEAVVGTTYSDKIIGNAISNRIEPLSGFDTIDGGPGIDTVVYEYPRSLYQISIPKRESSNRVIEVQAKNAPNFARPELKHDELSDIERIQFKDVGLAFDLAFNAGLAVKLLHLAFGDVDVSPALNGNVLRYVDQYSLAQGEVPLQAIEDLLMLDVFWGAATERTDRALTTLLLKRIWDQDPNSEENAELINGLTPLVPIFGGQAGFVQYIANHPDFELQIDFARYVSQGLLWT